MSTLSLEFSQVLSGNVLERRTYGGNYSISRVLIPQVGAVGIPPAGCFLSVVRNVVGGKPGS